MDTSKRLRIKDNGFKMLSCDHELKRGIIYALECLYGNDYYLIDNGFESHVDERSSVFRFGYYFQTFIEHFRPYSDYVVDIEYNRYGSDPKRVNGELKIPDLILHKRGINDNLLVMEFKTYWNDRNKSDILSDLDELKEITKQTGAYKYKYGLFILINKDKPLITVFKKGDYYSGVNEESYFDNKTWYKVKKLVLIKEKKIYTINTATNVMFPVIKSAFKLSDEEVYRMINNEHSKLKYKLKKKGVN